MIKPLREVAKTTLSRYEGVDPDPYYFYIIDPRNNTKIGFDAFISHLEEDYNKMLEDHDRQIREDI